MIAEDLSCRIKSLRDPTKKMSKSDPDPKSYINLLDKPDEIRAKIRKSITDCVSAVTFEPEERPGVANLITLHSMTSQKSPAEICNENQHLETGK